MAGTSSAVVEIPRLNIKTIEVPISGTSPLICHRFSTKIKQEMLDHARDPGDLDEKAAKRAGLLATKKKGKGKDELTGEEEAEEGAKLLEQASGGDFRLIKRDSFETAKIAGANGSHKATVEMVKEAIKKGLRGK